MNLEIRECAFTKVRFIVSLEPGKYDLPNVHCRKCPPVSFRPRGDNEGFLRAVGIRINFVNVPAGSSNDAARVRIRHFDPVAARVVLMHVHHCFLCKLHRRLAGLWAFILEGEQEGKKGNTGLLV